MPPFVICLLGAECTGKSTLAVALHAALAAEGHDVVRVDEALRAFCDRMQRTPQAQEQAGIAAEQTRRIAQAAKRHALVVADTSALLVALYSQRRFGDGSLLTQAVQAQRGYGLTLLTAPDLPWQPDGLQRDGPQERQAYDADLRALLARQGLAFSGVCGSSAERLAMALAAWRAAV